MCTSVRVYVCIINAQSPLLSPPTKEKKPLDVVFAMFLQKRGFCTFRQNKTKKTERRIKNANCKAKYVQKIYYICMYVSICLGYLTKNRGCVVIFTISYLLAILTTHRNVWCILGGAFFFCCLFQMLQSRKSIILQRCCKWEEVQVVVVWRYDICLQQE